MKRRRKRRKMRNQKRKRRRRTEEEDVDLKGLCQEWSPYSLSQERNHASLCECNMNL